MKGRSSSLDESIPPAELDAARPMRFIEGFYESRYSREAEARRIRHCLPIDAEAYCALILPWRAYVEGATGWQEVREEPFEGIAEAYGCLALGGPMAIGALT